MKKCAGILLVLFSGCLASGIAEANTYEIIVQQVLPAGEVYSQQCAAGKIWCNLPITLLGKSYDQKLVMMDVQIQGKQVNLQFNWEGRYLLTEYGKHQFSLPLHDQAADQKISLYIPRAEKEGEIPEELRKRPVMRKFPVLHVADLKLMVVPVAETR